MGNDVTNDRCVGDATAHPQPNEAVLIHLERLATLIERLRADCNHTNTVFGTLWKGRVEYIERELEAMTRIIAQARMASEASR